MYVGNNPIMTGSYGPVKPCFGAFRDLVIELEVQL